MLITILCKSININITILTMKITKSMRLNANRRSLFVAVLKGIPFNRWRYQFSPKRKHYDYRFCELTLWKNIHFHCERDDTCACVFVYLHQKQPRINIKKQKTIISAFTQNGLLMHIYWPFRTGTPFIHARFTLYNGPSVKFSTIVSPTRDGKLHCLYRKANNCCISSNVAGSLVTVPIWS